MPGNPLPRIAVLSGGLGGEHEVSLASGEVIVEGLRDHGGFLVSPVRIERDGSWTCTDRYFEPGKRSSPNSPESFRTDLPGALSHLLASGVQVAFLALHGAGGEDGMVQGLLEMAGIAYTGSGVGPSALAIDKVRTKELLSHRGIPTAPHLEVARSRWRSEPESVVEDLVDRLGLPLVLKPPTDGSSLGVSIVRDPDAIAGILDALFLERERVLAESFLDGVEVTCGVLVGEAPRWDPIALPVTEIVPRDGTFFDYEAKYTPGATVEITPARLDERLTGEIRDLALRAHLALGLQGLSRSDFIVVEGRPFFLETNSLPGMTRTSLFPQATRAAGIPFEIVLERLVEVALARGVSLGLAPEPPPLLAATDGQASRYSK